MPDPNVKDQLALGIDQGGDTAKEPDVLKPDDSKKVPDVVSREEFDQLASHAKTLTVALAEAGKKLEVIDRVAAMIQGKSAETLTKEEQLVISELHRLMPSLKFLDDIPKVQQVVSEAAKATSDTLITAAFGYQLELQKAAGLSIEDPKANAYIGSAITHWINQDDGRKGRFWRGDRSVVQEGFEEVKKSVIDPLRASERKTDADVLKHRPKSASPAAGGGGGEGPKTLDYSNPKAVREALKAALA